MFEQVKGCLDVEHTQAQKLRALIARLRLAPSAERPGERLHAVIHKEVKRCPNHSCALVSLANRFPEISEFFKADPQNLMDFAKTMQQIRNGRAACCSLGLSDHPHGKKAAHNGRHPVHNEIIYRSDAYSKYQMPVPEISYKSTDVEPTPGVCLCVCPCVSVCVRVCVCVCAFSCCDWPVTCNA